MSIYSRDEVCPEWEPVPWDLKSGAADEQERGLLALRLTDVGTLRHGVTTRSGPPVTVGAQRRRYSPVVAVYGPALS